MKKFIYNFYFLFSSNFAQRSYTKTYFKNGQLQAEGWLIKIRKFTGFIMKMEIKKKKAIMKQ
jgi:hypothetical protein